VSPAFPFFYHSRPDLFPFVVFVPLARMPLNPNGKVDKPALPFPDTVAAAAAISSASTGDSQKLTPTEKTIHDIWLRLLPSPPSEIPLDESFFDLGGHSILATRLIFELRQSLAVGAPLGIVFDHPTIRSLSHELDVFRDSDLGLTGASSRVGAAAVEDTEYADDEVLLIKDLAASYAKPESWTGPQTVFLTGATGFLGAFILRDLINRRTQVSKVICHVRAKTPEAAMARLRESGEGRGAWEESWVTEGLVEAVVGDLELPRLGMSEGEWSRIARESSIIVHNGAVVRPPFCASLDALADVVQWYRYTGSTLTPSFAPPTSSRRWLSSSSRPSVAPR
jgi:L-aminoadipate-semialdehyde dehydrogenase